jgi:gliding motility-associated-like protein
MKIGLLFFLLWSLQTTAQSVKAIEYFFDTDPGPGNGTRVNLNAATLIDTTVNFDISALSPGLHQLFVRALDSDDQWSLNHVYPVLIGVGNAAGMVEKIEYFFNTDPGVGNGIQLPIAAAATADVQATLDLSSLPDGLHQVYIRAMDNAGKWSLYHTYPVIKGPGTTQPLTVRQMEFFIDADPGVGRGTPIPVQAAYSIDSVFMLQLPPTDKDTVHLYIRAQDNRGLWGLYHDTIVVVSCALYRFKPGFSIDPEPACIDAPVQFTDSSNAGEWHWGFGLNDSSSLQNPVRRYATAGLHEISLYVVNAKGCVSDTTRKTITVSAPPVVDAGPDLELFIGDQATLNPIIGGTQLQYTWSPGTYMNNSSVRNPVITATENIQYKLSVSNAAGCTASDSLQVRVIKETRDIKVPNIFTPNGDGINDLWLIQYLGTYANCRVQVFNRYGQKVFESTGYNTPWNGKYNDQPLPFGTYYYVIELRKGMKALTGFVTIVR